MKYLPVPCAASRVGADVVRGGDRRCEHGSVMVCNAASGGDSRSLGSAAAPRNTHSSQEPAAAPGPPGSIAETICSWLLPDHLLDSASSPRAAPGSCSTHKSSVLGEQRDRL